ncbi:23 kDa integral membrane protein-like [Lycorma delicatula]|uniref:23 kDa integral membrane protein-like n=1 Tax=Lycorma delicatula TaxID=130591 RepID=UPI003F51562C
MTTLGSSQYYIGQFKTHYSIIFYIVIIVLFAICGLCLFILGCWFKISLSFLSNISTDLAVTIPVSIIILGFIIFIVSLIGMLFEKKPKHLLLYGYSLLFFFAILLVLYLSIYFYSPDSGNSLVDELISFMVAYRPKHVNMMDEIQTKFVCCGIEDPNDWLKMKLERIPQSCCIVEPCNTFDKRKIYTEGCRKSIKCFILEKKSWLLMFLFPSVLVAFFAIIVTINLANKLTRQEYERVE